MLHVPPGFHVSVYAQDLPNPRFMTLSPQGELMVSCPRAGQVLVFKGGTPHVFARGLHLPHGLAWHGGSLYVAETDAVVKLTPGASGVRRETVSRDLPGGGMHWTRTLTFAPDGTMLVSVGSDCNACDEPDPRRAAVLRMTPNASVFARGLRNAVGLAWAPDGKLWGTENGRDWLGDDLPPDELNQLVAGGDYGWPYAYGDRHPDPQHRRAAGITHTRAPGWTFQAHSAPLGCTFYAGSAFPAAYRGDLFVCLHGSWNRSSPVGYKVVRVHFEHGRPVSQADFLTGFLNRGRASARPVDVLTAPDGGLFVTDDADGHIYKVTYGG